jgi:hypothetical protein
VKANVRPEDAIGLHIDLDGVYGWDLQTVAGREEVRLRFIEKATKAIDAWMEDITVIEGKPKP